MERAEVVTGLMHKGAEKLFESRDYRQILSLANRHDWLQQFRRRTQRRPRVMEQALGIPFRPGPRPSAPRISELCRVNHHLYWLGETVAALGGEATRLRSARAAVTNALDLITGARMHLMIVRIGGLSMDVAGRLEVRAPLEQAARAAVDCLDGIADRLEGWPSFAGAGRRVRNQRHCCPCQRLGTRPARPREAGCR